MIVVGSNKLSLNEATMKIVIEYWLRNAVIDKNALCPKVTGVTYSQHNAYFHISLQENFEENHERSK